jgi:hypothetical protein
MPVFSTILSGSQGLYLSGSLAHSGSADLYGQTSFSGPAAAELASFEDAEAKGRIGVYDDRITMTYAAASVASAPEIYLRKSRGTLASPVVPNANDVLGEIVWQGYDTGWAKSVRIIGKAAAAHGGSSTDAPGKLEIWTTPDASDTPVKALTIESDQSATFEGDIQVGGNDIKDGGGNTQVTFTNASKAAFAYNVDVGGDLTVDGNNIKDAGGSSGITFDGSGNTTVDGTLTVDGGEVWGPENGQLKLYSDSDVIVKIDADNDGDKKFKVNVHGDNTKFSVDESGNVDIAGNIQMNNAQYIESVDSNDSDLNLRATGDVKMWIDSDGTTAHVRSFLIMTGSDGDSDAVFRIDESGNLTTAGGVQIGSNTIHASDGGNTITMDTSDNVTIGNNLKVGGNIIQASDGGSTITMDTSDNVTIGGNITAGSGNFMAAAGQGLSLQSSYNATIYIDTDEDSTATFKVSTGPSVSSTNMLTVDESGNMDLVGDLKVGGNIIKASDGGSTITMDTNDKVTLAGILQVSGNEILDNAGNTMFRFDGAGNIDDVAVITQDVVIGGAAPSLTLGDGGDEDVRLQFNSDVNDFYVGSDNATDTLQIGVGSGVGLNVGWQIVSSSLVAMPEGVYQSPAVTTGPGGTTGNAATGQWIRILKTPTGGVTSQKQTGGVYLVSMAGTDYGGASYQADWSWIVSVRYGTSGNPMDADATSIRVEQLDTSILGSSLTPFEPTTDIKLVDDGARNAEVWIKNISRYKQCFVTHLGGGSNGSDLSNRNDKSFEVQANQTWFGSAPVGAGANIFGQWTSKVFTGVATDKIEAITTNLTLDAVGDIILSADGNQITMDDGTTTRFTFNVDSTPELDVVGAFKLDGSSTVEIESTGNMTLDSSADIILSAAGAVSIPENIGFQASTYQYLDFCGSIKSTDLSTWRAFRHGQGDGLDFIAASTDPQGLIYHHWIAPCDGTFVSFQFEAKYNFKSSTGNNTGNDDDLYFRMYKLDYADYDASSDNWTQVGTQMLWDSDNYTSYSGFLAPDGRVFATKRTGDFTTFGESFNGNDDYNTTDGSADIEDTWVFSRGDKIVLAMYWNPHDDANPFYDQLGGSSTTDTNDIKIGAVVRFDWNTGYNL